MVKIYSIVNIFHAILPLLFPSVVMSGIIGYLTSPARLFQVDIQLRMSDLTADWKP